MSGALALVAAAPAGAQSTTEQASPTRTTTNANSGDIIVTATRRETKLLDTPVAMTVISGDLVAQTRVTGLEDATLLVPNANFIKASGASGSFVSLRGKANANRSPAVDSPVSYFIDDVYYGSGASAYPDIYDVSQVEVLRGPQGTTFGRNVTGGAIVIRSREPEHEFNASLSGTYGNRDLMEAKGYINTPLGDALSARVAFSARKQDGYQTNVFNGDDLAGTEFYSARGMLKYDAGDRTDILLTANYTRDKSASPGANFFVTGDGPNLPAFAGAVFSENPRIVEQDVSNQSNAESIAASLRVNHDLDFATLTSITAYRHLKSDYTLDTDATRVDLNAQMENQKEEQWSQEFRLTSPNGQAFEWIAGVFLLHQKFRRHSPFTLKPVAGSVLSLIQPTAISAALFQEVKVDSVAPFFEGVYRFSPMIALRAGVRYTYDKKKGTTAHLGDSNAVTGAAYSTPIEDHWEAFTPRVTLELKPSDDFFAYATASRGFNSGGFDQSATTAAVASQGYKKETVWNYEGGIRGQFAGNKLQFSLTYFKQNTKNLQVLTFNAGTATFGLSSAGIKSEGVEFEATLHPIPAIDLGLSYGYIDAKYDNYVCAAPNIRCDGNPVSLVPKESLVLFAGGRLDLGGSGELFSRVEAQFRSDYTLGGRGIEPDALEDQTGYNGLINAQLGWKSEDDRYGVTLWGRNLTNKYYVNNAVDLSVFYLGLGEFLAGESIHRALYSGGRSYGITLTGKF